MSIQSVFKCSIPNCSYFFKNGKQAPFIGGKFSTGIEAEVAELKEEINKGHPHLYIDANEKEIDTEALTPLQALEEKIRAQVKAEMMAASAKDNDRGTSDQGGKLTGIASSANTAEGVAAAEITAQNNITAKSADAITAKLSNLLKK